MNNLVNGLVLHGVSATISNDGADISRYFLLPYELMNLAFLRRMRVPAGRWSTSCAAFSFVIRMVYLSWRFLVPIMHCPEENSAPGFGRHVDSVSVLPLRLLSISDLSASEASNGEQINASSDVIGGWWVTVSCLVPRCFCFCFAGREFCRVMVFFRYHWWWDKG